MPQTALPNIGVQFEFTLGTNDWKNGTDSSMVILDSQVQAFVIDQRTAEPGGPAVGDTYLLGPGGPSGVNWPMTLTSSQNASSSGTGRGGSKSVGSRHGACRGCPSVVTTRSHRSHSVSRRGRAGCGYICSG